MNGYVAPAQASLQLFGYVRERVSLPVEVIPVGWPELAQARVLINRYHDQDLSLTDTCSAVLMRRNNIRQIASYDRHFTVLRFEMLP
jgi:predicted nucleic acid-binding protein